jgi:hypothetical protein
LFYLYIIADKLIGLTYKGLGKLEAQDRCVKPVEIGPPVSGLVNKNIQQFILRTALVTEDKLLFALPENQLFACFSHDNHVPCRLNNPPGTTFPFSLSVVIRNT